MIKTSDLRTGNWFSLHNEYGYCGDVQILAEAILLLQKKRMIFESSYVPFELVEEWLEEFGFVQNKTMKSLWHIMELHVRYDIVIKELTVYLGEGATESIYFRIKDVKYVHQLQNIFSVNFGIELERKMKYRADSILKSVKS